MTRVSSMPSPRLRASGIKQKASEAARPDQFDWLAVGAFVIMHAGCLAVFLVGWSWTAVSLAVLLYLTRAFGLTAFYHRYFSHRAFKTSRWFQFGGALLGCLALQKGPLWWAAHHRGHHRFSDREGDMHSPHVHSVLWAHMCWFLTLSNKEVNARVIRDWMKFPELRWLDFYAPLVAVGYGAALYALGDLLSVRIPSLETDGPQLFVWGFFLSTVALYHATYCVNSLAHLFGSRRYDTPDDSRNNWLVALFTLGEGWHNNHHHYPSSVRQGFFWWEIDLTYYVLVGFERMGLVWGLRPVPMHVLRRELVVTSVHNRVDTENSHASLNRPRQSN